MSYSKLRKKYVIILWIGIISLFVGHFYLSSLYPDHQGLLFEYLASSAWSYIPSFCFDE